jgi:hypothetical protein
MKNKYIRGILLLFLIWLAVVVVTSLSISDPSEFQGSSSALAIFALLVTYTFQVWKVKWSLLKKIVLGLGVWVVGTAGTLIGHLLFGYGYIGVLLIVLISLYFPLPETLEKEK